jgi:hypothetical protein
MMLTGCRAFSRSAGAHKANPRRRQHMSNKAHDENDAVPHPGFPGPGYGGFGGSAGYSGNGPGGISGGYAGGGATEGPWRPVPNTLHDDQIETDVRERLQQATDVDASEIEIGVEAGVVTLSGSVETRDMKHVAGDIAARVLGVSQVLNQLHVEQPLLDELRERLTGHKHSESR